MSSTALNVSPTNRPKSYVGTACDQCFRCKVRCDSNRPCCSRCLRSGSLCTYSSTSRPGTRRKKSVAASSKRGQQPYDTNRRRISSPFSSSSSSSYCASVPSDEALQYDAFCAPHPTRRNDVASDTLQSPPQISGWDLSGSNWDFQGIGDPDTDWTKGFLGNEAQDPRPIENAKPARHPITSGPSTAHFALLGTTGQLSLSDMEYPSRSSAVASSESIEVIQSLPEYSFSDIILKTYSACNTPNASVGTLLSDSRQTVTFIAGYFRDEGAQKSSQQPPQPSPTFILACMHLLRQIVLSYCEVRLRMQRAGPPELGKNCMRIDNFEVHGSETHHRIIEALVTHELKVCEEVMNRMELKIDVIESTGQEDVHCLKPFMQILEANIKEALL